MSGCPLLLHIFGLQLIDEETIRTLSPVSFLSVEDRYKLVLSPLCHCCLFLASGKKLPQ